MNLSAALANVTSQLTDADTSLLSWFLGSSPKKSLSMTSVASRLSEYRAQKRASVEKQQTREKVWSYVTFWKKWNFFVNDESDNQEVNA